MGAPVRLQKLLSQAGVASRRRAERYIESGRVRVNGRVVTELGTKVDPDVDVVEVDGRPVRPAPTVWIALHKPVGVVSTRRDPQGRPTLYGLLPPELSGLFHVGRLDADSEGLILLTNDGETAHRLTHPRYGVDRVYEVEVEGPLDSGVLARLRGGVRLEDGVARPEAARVLEGASGRQCRLELVLREGRKREVRRMLAALGHPVLRLVRRRYGPVELGRLASGGWRRLGEREVRALETTTRGPR